VSTPIEKTASEAFACYRFFPLNKGGRELSGEVSDDKGGNISRGMPGENNNKSQSFENMDASYCRLGHRSLVLFRGF
jgi:hypothetical protein